MTSKPYEELIELVADASLLGSTGSLLGWDQETMMPRAGVEYRARQLAQLSGLIHSKATDPRIGDLLDECDETDLVAAANVREIKRSYEKATKLPESLVKEVAHTGVLAREAWIDARAKSDYSIFAPWLEKNLGLGLSMAECYGWPSDGEPWDAFADSYEAGMTAAGIEKVFTDLRPRLQALLDDLLGSSVRPSNRFNELELPIESQRRFCRFAASAIGFDFERGRLDESAHPFCGGTHPNDVRMTTRYRTTEALDSLTATLHESGHGMYEQGLPLAHLGTPAGSSCSLGFHESQSRLWENLVGRSLQFWVWCTPKLPEFFGEAISGISPEEMYATANLVAPSLIRVEADEATYNMHIMVRFELERAMLRGELPVSDLPNAWNSAYKEYLGIDVPDDARGCLQDVHWSGVSYGYWPTYSLGNLYGAQLFESARDAIPGLEDGFARGEFAPLLSWLRDNVHSQGGIYLPGELCERATGTPLSADPLMRHLDTKFRPLYGV